MRENCHPLLREWEVIGGSRKYKGNRKLTCLEMDSLTSVCEVFIPSLPLSSFEGNNKEVSHSKAIESFFASSASEYPIPQEIAELLKKRAIVEGFLIVRLLLFLLGTRVGTFMVCGSLCLNKKWPFIYNFSKMPLKKREQVVQKWLRHKFITPLRLAFLYIKVLCFHTFFSRVNEEGENPAYEAIGYVIKDYKREEMTKNTTQIRERPLEKGIIETVYKTDSSLYQSLLEKGLKVTQEPHKNLLTIHCDVVVVGSGSGGGVAAAVLARSGERVVVVEKGNYFAPWEYSAMDGPSSEELYECGGTFASTCGKMAILAGSAVGGGTVVNWSASIRTPDKVLEEWAEKEGLGMFRSAEYETASDRVWERLGITGGCEREGFQNRVLRRGCERLGARVETVSRNSPENHFCGFECGFGCRSGGKKGTELTWLVDAVRDGAVILSGCKAERFILEKNKSGGRKRSLKCLGLIARVSGEGVGTKVRIQAKATIAACGALFTPPLMIRSGMKNKHIGRNLHMHPVMMSWGYFPESEDRDTIGPGKCHEGGIITSVHRVISNDDNKIIMAIIETPALAPGSFSALFPWTSGREMKNRMAKYSRTAHLITIIRDQGCGEARAEGRVSYALSDSDRANMTAGIRQALRILIAAGAEEVGTHRSDGQSFKCLGASQDQIEEFLDSVRAVGGAMEMSEHWTNYGSAHQLGSCRMGRDEREGAVDPNGESWEAEGLFVCDASVLPSAVGVNPMITIQATAYCLSNRIAESLRNRRL